MSAADGRPRCTWANSAPEYIAYHDDEWGNPVHGDTALYERLTLEAFQSGLSWITILRKREAFRAAFCGFRPEDVAGFQERDIARLMSDAAIVRNRRKIAAAVTNARALLELQRRDGGDALDRLMWAYADPAQRERPLTLAAVPSSTDRSAALCRELKAHGFVWLGPTTVYAAMQACGIVDDHIASCWRATVPQR